jgi:hypothetical protein
MPLAAGKRERRRRATGGGGRALRTTRVHIPTVAFRPADTTPEAWATQFDLYRRMSPADKARLCREITLAANAFALAGLRQRHPGASERELRLRLAALRLGADLVECAYHWRAPTDGA